MLLQTPDAVVADDRDDRHAVPDQRVEVPEREADRAVAEHEHDLAIGVCNPGGDARSRARAQTAVRAGVEPAPGS